MSDPVSNAEIEDVLSSIRRLISAGKPDSKETFEPVDEDGNKLLLTSAFRVFEGDLAEPANTDAEGKPSQPVGARDIPVEKLDLAELDTVEANADVEDSALPDDDAPVVDVSLDPLTFEEGHHSDADMPIALSDSQADVEDNWEADAMGESAQVAFLHNRRSMSDSIEDADDDLSMVAGEAAEDESTVAEDELSDGDVQTTAEIQQTISAVEGEMAESDLDEVDKNEVCEPSTEHAEGDVDASEEAAEKLAENEDEAPSQESDDIDGVVAPVGKAPAAEIFDDDFEFIDEGHLQELVARIVREELKGEIGEKITQAVRRMVRREVTRALSLEKFD
ncbi:hypothetical protein SAMN04488030_2971 [Aliiroseovarius halocynthiae]|uniref:DUF2497 domain-containing protein n=1 Tax=Aliiroseovarius halocynthiae TaxID=985055 RepID=A0A545SN28_9RHOB|nr:hypothetical protein [Aliiroseovarius halocynthiae]TQV66266.1 hypothetical protein FIL88_14555 [Aliiroseovarius halocynthiae]SMR82612.1 hypothetical protein SAMN04488030_2971 [Aliiroseovarius halocynthiae]